MSVCLENVGRNPNFEIISKSIWQRGGDEVERVVKPSKEGDICRHQEVDEGPLHSAEAVMGAAGVACVLKGALLGRDAVPAFTTRRGPVFTLGTVLRAVRFLHGGGGQGHRDKGDSLLHTLPSTFLA